MTRRLLDFVYLVVGAVLGPWLVARAWLAGKRRQGFREKLFGLIPPREPGPAALWLHAVSVGEVNVAAGFAEAWRQACPDVPVVLTTFTASGQEAATRRLPWACVRFGPFDFSWAVHRALDRLRPAALVLVELELWPHLVLLPAARGIPVFIINGRLSERSARGYARLAAMVRALGLGDPVAALLRRITHIAAQSEADAARFLALGADPARTTVSGSLKYDGAETDRHAQAVERLRRLAGIEPDDLVFLAGSTGDPEESIILDAWAALGPLPPRARLLIAPRHPERFAAVAELLARRGLPFERRSDLADASPPTDAFRPSILLLDQVGELRHWWGVATAGFVGGSLNGRGGQNMIEPAAYGVATCFGPGTRNFRDVVARLLGDQAAVVVRDAAELADFWRLAVDRPAEAVLYGARARAVVASQLGATRRTLERIAAAVAPAAPVSPPHTVPARAAA